MKPRLRQPTPAEHLEPARMKFYTALICYGSIGLLAALTLDGKLRLAVWILLAGLAVKSYLHTLTKP